MGFSGYHTWCASIPLGGSNCNWGFTVKEQLNHFLTTTRANMARKICVLTIFFSKKSEVCVVVRATSSHFWPNPAPGLLGFAGGGVLLAVAKIVHHTIVRLCHCLMLFLNPPPPAVDWFLSATELLWDRHGQLSSKGKKNDAQGKERES